MRFLSFGRLKSMKEVIQHIALFLMINSDDYRPRNCSQKKTIS